MKPIFLYILFSICVFNFSFGQTPGEWVWLHGDSIIGNPGNFGIQGISDPANFPPTLYEACEWRDPSGNFWLFGGSGLGTVYADLWKYDPLINEWTWMKGPGTPYYNGVYGVQGVPGTNNNPPSTGLGALSWIDDFDNLWMYAGEAPSGGSSDLWKYNIATNEWTWMKGHGVFYELPVYGLQYVPDTGNTPGYRSETAASWVDDSGGLWFFGGWSKDSIFYGARNDLWRFDINTNNWKWMKGSSLTDQSGSYGTRGVEDPSNCPDARMSYCRWKGLDGNFWIFGGWDYIDSCGQTWEFHNDLWKYNIATNNWTWMNGSSTSGSIGSYGIKCAASSANSPPSRRENRIAWTDQDGDFWMFGGTSDCGVRNDLWKYCVSSNTWIWISNVWYCNPYVHWGTKGISSSLNYPPGRCGAIGWTNQDDHLYLFGGSLNDLWMYTIDSTCGSCSTIFPQADFSPSTNSLCPGSCISFDNLSSYAMTYHWNFLGASPDSSTAISPTNICYPSPGTYDVQLIASNANGSDTLLLTNYITVYPSPPPQSITQTGDTLIAITGSASYQWYLNGNIINGATDYFYVGSQSGDYNLIATDSNGCEVEAAIFNVIADLPSTALRPPLSVFPNPVAETLNVIGYSLIGTAFEISVYNLLGEKVMAVCCGLSTVDCRLLLPGIYFLEISSSQNSSRAKFIKE
jgi:PKD repeat protein